MKSGAPFRIGPSGDDADRGLRTTSLAREGPVALPLGDGHPPTTGLVVEAILVQLEELRGDGGALAVPAAQGLIHVVAQTIRLGGGRLRDALDGGHAGPPVTSRPRFSRLPGVNTIGSVSQFRVTVLWLILDSVPGSSRKSGIRRMSSSMVTRAWIFAM